MKTQRNQMRHYALVTLLSISAVLLSACSTTPVTKKTATRVPSSRIYAPKLTQPRNEASATVAFFRDAGYLGSACTHTIYVNNKRAFGIDPAEYLTLYLKPGNYLFLLKSGGGMCPNVAISQSTNLSSGDSQRYRILIPSNAIIHMTRVR